MENDKPYLDCVHCGLCLPSCPTYRTLASEPDSPRGRIYLMRAFDEGRIAISDAFAEHMFRCLDCRACETACPSGVKFGHMMEEMRAVIVQQRPGGRLARFMLERVFPYPGRFRAAARLLQLYQYSGLQDAVRASGLLRRISAKLAEVEELTPAVAVAGIEPGVSSGLHRAAGRSEGTVAFFTGCVMNSMLGRINRATVRVLNAAGYDVFVPEDQVCCGALANHSGLRSTAVESAKRNIAAFAAVDARAVIVNAAGCGSMLKEYGGLVENGAAFSARVQDIAEFLVSTRIAERLSVPVRKRVGYDDPCHLIHGQRIQDAPRRLLRAVPGLDLVEVEGADQCCGSAGIYNIVQHELSMAILDAKMEQIRKANLDVLATGNPGCMFQFRYGARRAGIALDVVHPVELLAESAT